MERLFTFLFKYRPVAFERGAFAFEPAGPWWLMLALALGAAAAAAVLYARTSRLALRDRAVLAGLRASILLLLATCLAGPVLLVATVVPQRNVLAVLIDRSRSMRITDEGGRSRLAAALAHLAPGSGSLMSTLAERFDVRTFAYADQLEPLLTDSISPAGMETDLATALDDARERFSGRNLAGVVVAGDGGNVSESLTEVLLRYRADGVPVHAVALGEERPARDVSLEVLSLPARVLRHSAMLIEVRLSQRGYSGTTVPISVEDGSGIVGRASVRLPGDGDAVSVPVRFTLDEPGPRRLRVRVPVQSAETVAENNVREAVVDVVDREARILYFEGEPRFEVKFLRRAVAEDQELHVSTLLRTADEKFLRLDVSDSIELAAGFPRSRSELYAYQGLVLGSVEASFFTRDQLRMIADFVRERGGGLMVLGGRRALGTGGFAETPVADALPIELPAADTTFFSEVAVRPTPAGRRHAALRLGADEADRRWDSLPPLSILHPVRSLKPGAVALLEGMTPEGRYVVLASQRYGRGRSAALNAQDTWMWQMHASIAPEDQTHETLWRQLLRWLVSETPERVSVRATRGAVAPGRAISLVADVADSVWAPLNGAEVIATVRSPDGEERQVPLTWHADRDGEYTGSAASSMTGLYEVVVDARAPGQPPGQARTWVTVGDPGTEFQRVGRQSDVLRRLAAETGGGYYTTASVAGLAEDARFTTAGATTQEHFDLWDMPAVLLALLGLLGAEWGYRRARGLA